MEMTVESMATASGLVRAVMRDGSVWWVRPASKAWYETQATAGVPRAYRHLDDPGVPAQFLARLNDPMPGPVR
jgi:hypothetical protein